MAEPDQVDFNTVAQARWGVIEGCLVTVSGSQAQCTLGGLALVNGILVNVAPGQTATLGTGGSQDRFDLITVDEGRHAEGGHQGIPAIDPIYPDPVAHRDGARRCVRPDRGVQPVRATSSTSASSSCARCSPRSVQASPGPQRQRDRQPLPGHWRRDDDLGQRHRLAEHPRCANLEGDQAPGGRRRSRCWGTRPGSVVDGRSGRTSLAPTS